MTTPTVNLGLSHIQTEFGGSNPIAISEYYGVNANVAASGLIKMSQFLGISSGPPAAAANVTSSVSDLAEAGIRHTFGANGTMVIYKYEVDAGYYNYTSSTWRGSGYTSGQFDVRATKTGAGNIPTFSAGWANNTWAVMSSDRYFELIASADNLLYCTMAVDIRWNANGTIISSGTHNLTAEDYK